MKYAFIERNRHHWPVSVLCEVLEVSPSGYHQRRQRIVAGGVKPLKDGVARLSKALNNKGADWPPYCC